jgi:hypothetical protein
VKAHEGEAYLAITTEGFLDPRMLAIMLSSVPGLTDEDWLPEPGSHMEFEPQPGQITFSTMIPADVQARILDEFTASG